MQNQNHNQNNQNQSADTTKYIIHSKISANGIIERPDIVGAIFGQTEGLLGKDLDLRDLQKTGRIGRIEVLISGKGGKSKGTILIPSSLDRVETSVLAAALETIDRVGPCSAKIEVSKIEDIRATKRKNIIERARMIYSSMFDDNLPESQEIADEVRESLRIHEMEYYGKNKIPCGPEVFDSDEVILVEGRADVLNLLRYGIKNTICVGGTNIPSEIAEITKKRNVTAFTDGDRGGVLIIKELLQVANIDYIARAPEGKSVEDLVHREVMRALQQRVPIEQAMESYTSKPVESSKTGKSARDSKRKDNRSQDLQKSSSLKPKNLDKETEAVSQQEVQESFTEEVEITEEPVVTEEPEPQFKFKPHIDAISGTLDARLLDSGEELVEEIAVRDLVNKLKNYNGEVVSVVFDGVITQRILDVSSEKGIKNLVGVKLGNVTKVPTGINIFTENDYC
ncbi:DNA primase DnaG [Methanohalobium sp.]|uniref:DNA primase DnaG n=1 Tax=Methanohalobium sp. TaxID=2837493 RepID=UPI0025F7EF87|nr:DNA primase DnaG [Methanohalobium sp.]